MERVFRREIVRRLFFVFAGARGNAVRDIPVFWAQRKIPVDLHFIVRLLLRLEDMASVAPSIKVKILHLSTPPVHAGVAAACPCGRTLRSWSDVFPCGDAARACGQVKPWTATREGARRAAVGRVAPTGRTCPQAPGGNWPDGNTGGIDNYPVCLRHSGQQSHTYYCLLLSVSWFCRCPCHRATCVMTVSVSTLLTGKCIYNCLYLN